MKRIFGVIGVGVIALALLFGVMLAPQGDMLRADDATAVRAEKRKRKGAA